MVIINIQSLIIFILLIFKINNIHSCDKYLVDSKQIELAIPDDLAE